jgi:glycosyl transferase family 2
MNAIQLAMTTDRREPAVPRNTYAPTPQEWDKLESLVRRRALDELVDHMRSSFELSADQSRACRLAVQRLFDGAPLDEPLFKTDATKIGQQLLRARFPEPPTPVSLPAQIGREFDDLAQGVPHIPAIALCCIANWLVPKTDDVVVVTSIRNEGPWILEWIAFYRALNVKNIIVFHNDNDDGSDELLDLLNATGHIHVVRNDVAHMVSPQKKAFNYAVHLMPVIHSHRWVCYFDADEFLWPLVPGTETIGDLISLILESGNRNSALSADEICAIMVHWRWFASASQFAWKDGEIIDRFRSSRSNAHVKAIVRPEAIWSMERLHCPTLRSSGCAIDSAGYKLNGLREELDPPRYETCQLNHYFAKSFEEFALKKARGRGAIGTGAAQRDYGNFNWGTDQVTDLPLPNQEIGVRTKKMMAEYLAIPRVADCVELVTRTTRQRLADLDREIGLRGVYEEVMRGDPDRGAAA